MYVVAGATGQTGKAVAEALLAAGKNVTVLARNEGKTSAWKAKGAWIAVVDLGDERSPDTRGADGAYLLIPPDYAASDYSPIAAGSPDRSAAPCRAPAFPTSSFFRPPAGIARKAPA
jgi:uncharacterized protein YbjT (DUF2867 family)